MEKEFAKCRKLISDLSKHLEKLEKMFNEYE